MGIVGITGPYKLASLVQQKITEFLKDQLSLTMNESKTKIVNFHSETVRFLGADIRREKTLIRTRKMGNTMTKKRVAGRPQMFAPMIELPDKLVQNGIAVWQTHPDGKRELVSVRWTKAINLDHHQIVHKYNWIHRGVLNYYTFRSNRWPLLPPPFLLMPLRILLLP